MTRKVKNGREGAHGEDSRSSARGHVAPYYIYVRARETRRRMREGAPRATDARADTATWIPNVCEMIKNDKFVAYFLHL